MKLAGNFSQVISVLALALAISWSTSGWTELVSICPILA